MMDWVTVENIMGCDGLGDWRTLWDVMDWVAVENIMGCDGLGDCGEHNGM